MSWARVFGIVFLDRCAFLLHLFKLGFVSGFCSSQLLAGAYVTILLESR